MAALLAVVAMAPARAAPGDDLDAVVARVLEAYGGALLPEPGRILRSTGRLHAGRDRKGAEILREVAWPDYLRVEIARDGGARETRVLLGDRGWRDGSPAPVPLVRAMRLQAARLSLPMLLGWERAALSDLGRARRADGRAVRRLRLDLGGSLELFVEIAEPSGRILRSAGVMSMGGAKVSFGATYSEFRSFGALTWRAREAQHAMGRPIGRTEIETLERGPPFDRDTVKP